MSRSYRVFRSTAVLCIALAISAGVARATQASRVPASTVQGVSPSQLEARRLADSIRQDVRVMQEQVAVLRGDSDRILSTALFALGIAATLVVAVVGVLSYVNSRSADRDRRALSTELHGLVATETATLQTLVASEIAKLQDLVAKANQSSLNAVGALRSELPASVESQIDERSGPPIRNLESALASLKASLATHELHNDAEFLAVSVKLASPASTIVRAAARVACKAVEAKVDWRVGRALEVLEEHMPKAGKLDSFDESAVTDALNAAKATQPIACERISALLLKNGN